MSARAWKRRRGKALRAFFAGVRQHYESPLPPVIVSPGNTLLMFLRQASPPHA